MGKKFYLWVAIMITANAFFSTSVKAASFDESMRSALHAENQKQALEELVHKYPEEASALFLYAQHLFNEGLYSQSESLFLRLLKINPDYPYANLLLGQIAYDQRRPKQAIKYLNREIKINNTADAYYWLGKSYQQIKKWDKAASSYEIAIRLKTRYLAESRIGLSWVYGKSGELDKKPQLAGSDIRDFSLQREEQKRKPLDSSKRWGLTAGSQMFYTDNVAGTDDKVARPPDQNHRYDFGSAWYLNSDVALLESDNFDLDLEYDYFQNLHFEAEDYNVLSNTVNIRPAFKWDSWTLGTNLKWNHLNLSGDPYRYSLEAAPFLRYRHQRLLLESGYSWKRSFYSYSPQLQPEQDRDNQRHQINLSIIYFFPKCIQFAATGINFGIEDNEGIDYDQRFIGGYFAVRTHSWKRLYADASVNWTLERYLHPNTAALIYQSQIRHSQDVNLSFGLTRLIGDHGLEIYTRYDYARSDSNITFYTYTTNTVTAGMRWRI